MANSLLEQLGGIPESVSSPGVKAYNSISGGVSISYKNSRVAVSLFVACLVVAWSLVIACRSQRGMRVKVLKALVQRVRVEDKNSVHC